MKAKNKQEQPVNLEGLKYCPRTRHSNRPIKNATPRCSQLGRNEMKHGVICDPCECCWRPNLQQYCKQNDIPVTFKLRFRCVLEVDLTLEDYGFMLDQIGIDTGKEWLAYSAQDWRNWIDTFQIPTQEKMAFYAFVRGFVHQFYLQYSPVEQKGVKKAAEAGFRAIIPKELIEFLQALGLDYDGYVGNWAVFATRLPMKPGQVKVPLLRKADDYARCLADELTRLGECMVPSRSCAEVYVMLVRWIMDKTMAEVQNNSATWCASIKEQ